MCGIRNMWRFLTCLVLFIIKLDKTTIIQLIKDLSAAREQSSPTKKKQPKLKFGSSPGTPTAKASLEKKTSPPKTPTSFNEEPKTKIILENVEHKDNSFREFRRLCATVSEESSYNTKTEIMQKLFSKGSDGIKFKGNIHLWVRLMLPGVIKRVYNLQSKQLIKIYSRIFQVDEDEMLEDLEKGISIFYSSKQQ